MGKPTTRPTMSSGTPAPKSDPIPNPTPAQRMIVASRTVPAIAASAPVVGRRGVVIEGLRGIAVGHGGGHPSRAAVVSALRAACRGLGVHLQGSEPQELVTTL